ncbi:MAG: c-type cytochrome [Bacteroidales bacterium]|nr:c-type cytochrome [Bacteroidales bacterium]
MKIRFKTFVSLGLLTTALLCSVTTEAQDGATLYKSCVACHTIGGGKTVGPDLKGVTKRRTKEWLVKFIQSPVKIQKAGDADAVALFKEYNNMPMPDNAMTDEQVVKLLDHIDGGSSGAETVDPLAAASQHRVDSILKANSPQDIQVGRELFYGTRSFTNGGVSCASCHNATSDGENRGGILAKDLTKVHSRVGGFAGVKGFIQSAPFPSMNQSYKNAPVTDDEIAYIGLFLKHTDEQNATEPAKSSAWMISYTLVAAFLIVAAILLIWGRRRRTSVNEEIIKRQEKISK